MLNSTLTHVGVLAIIQKLDFVIKNKNMSLRTKPKTTNNNQQTDIGSPKQQAYNNKLCTFIFLRLVIQDSQVHNYTDFFISTTFYSSAALAKAFSLP